MINELPNFLDKSECDYMVNLIKDSNPVDTTENNRKVDVFPFKNISEVPFLEKKMLKINIINNPSFYINRYSEDYFFDTHVDMGGKNDPKYERLKTLIINLSDENEYSGGELIIKDKLMSKKIGDAHFFDSNIRHELKKITNGIRYSLVLWLKKQHLKYASIL